MHNPPDILSLAYKQTSYAGAVRLLQEKEQQSRDRFNIQLTGITDNFNGTWKIRA